MRFSVDLAKANHLGFAVNDHGPVWVSFLVVSFILCKPLAYFCGLSPGDDDFSSRAHCKRHQQHPSTCRIFVEPYIEVPRRFGECLSRAWLFEFVLVLGPIFVYRTSPHGKHHKLVAPPRETLSGSISFMRGQSQSFARGRELLASPLMTASSILLERIIFTTYHHLPPTFFEKYVIILILTQVWGGTTAPQTGEMGGVGGRGGGAPSPPSRFTTIYHHFFTNIF